jgi:pimeloyl-ACP methyl ester carboxylesterase
MEGATQVRRMFIHGLESSGRGFKGRLLRGVYGDTLTPDFRGDLPERMAQLEPLLEGKAPWILVGSSFGGLMAALAACHHPSWVHRLILLAPALHHPEFLASRPVPVPTLVVHGTRDEVVPLGEVRTRAERAFPHLTFRQVDDDHLLHATVQALDWRALLVP